MSTEAEKRVILENSIRRGLKRREFVIYYQPQLDLTTGEIVGMEALVRWQNPDFGLVAPLEFIPIAEKTGLICLWGNGSCVRPVPKTEPGRAMGCRGCAWPSISRRVNFSSRTY